MEFPGALAKHAFKACWHGLPCYLKWFNTCFSYEMMVTDGCSGSGESRRPWFGDHGKAKRNRGEPGICPRWEAKNS